MSITEAVHDYWNRASCGTNTTAAEKFSRAYFDEIEQFRYRYEPAIPVFARFPEWKGKKVLEVGVGAGTDFLQFARAGAILSGVDLTEEAVANASHRLEVYNLPPADLRVCNAEKLPFDDASFDLVWSWGVIHHANDTEQCLREIARVARPGGSVKVMLYNLDSVHTWVTALRHGTLDRRKAMWSYQESVGTKAYTEGEAGAMAARCGLQVTGVSYSDQLIRKGARLEGLRRVIQNLSPDNRRWYMALDMKR